MSELRGCLRDLGLVPLVRFLSQQERTGRLRLARAGLEGEFVFKRGRIASVMTGSERGQSAVELIALALADADFMYADDSTTSAVTDAIPDKNILDVELERFVHAAAHRPTPILVSVPHVRESNANLPDAEVALNREDLAVLLAMDGRRTTAEVLQGHQTLHALQTLTRLSDLGLIQLDPQHAKPGQELPANEIPATRENSSVAVAEVPFQGERQSAPPAVVSLPPLRAGPFRHWHIVREAVQLLVLTALFVVALRAIVQGVRIEGQSMLPALHEGQLLVVDRLSYLHDEGSILANLLPYTLQGAIRYPLGGPRRGEVAVFYSPTEPDVELVKRVIGLPGEDLRIESGRVFINGASLEEPYVSPADGDFDRYPADGQSIHIPDDSYFVLGDNRAVSQDSRSGWLVQASNLVGRAWLAYWPPSAWGFIAQAESAPVAEPSTVTGVDSAAATAVTPNLNLKPVVPTPPPIREAAAAEPRTLLSGAVRNQPGWPSDPTGTAWSDGLAYHLSAVQPGHFVAVAAPTSFADTDVTVTAAFHKTGGPPGGGYGIIVRDRGPGPRDGLNQAGYFYVAEVGDVGEVGIWRHDDDHWVDLLPWTRSDAVNIGGTTNELTLRAQGQRLTFLVNGREVATVADHALANGRVGAFVGGDFNDVRLDRFTVEIPAAGVAR